MKKEKFKILISKEPIEYPCKKCEHRKYFATHYGCPCDNMKEYYKKCAYVEYDLDNLIKRIGNILFIQIDKYPFPMPPLYSEDFFKDLAKEIINSILEEQYGK